MSLIFFEPEPSSSFQSQARTSPSFLNFCVEPSFYEPWQIFTIAPRKAIAKKLFQVSFQAFPTLHRMFGIVLARFLSSSLGQSPEKKLGQAFQNQVQAFPSQELIFCAEKFRPGPPSPSLGSFHLYFSSHFSMPEKTTGLDQLQMAFLSRMLTSCIFTSHYKVLPMSYKPIINPG